jgi:hypothetical protein
MLSRRSNTCSTSRPAGPGWSTGLGSEGPGSLSAELLPNGTLTTYAGFPYGMPTTHAATINADLLAFEQS